MTIYLPSSLNVINYLQLLWKTRRTNCWTFPYWLSRIQNSSQPYLLSQVQTMVHLLWQVRALQHNGLFQYKVWETGAPHLRKKIKQFMISYFDIKIIIQSTLYNGFTNLLVQILVLGGHSNNTWNFFFFWHSSNPTPGRPSPPLLWHFMFKNNCSQKFFSFEPYLCILIR